MHNHAQTQYSDRQQQHTSSRSGDRRACASLMRPARSPPLHRSRRESAHATGAHAPPRRSRRSSCRVPAVVHHDVQRPVGREVALVFHDTRVVQRAQQSHLRVQGTHAHKRRRAQSTMCQPCTRHACSHVCACLRLRRLHRIAIQLCELRPHACMRRGPRPAPRRGAHLNLFYDKLLAVVIAPRDKVGTAKLQAHTVTAGLSQAAVSCCRRARSTPARTHIKRTHAITAHTHNEAMARIAPGPCPGT